MAEEAGGPNPPTPNLGQDPNPAPQNPTGGQDPKPVEQTGGKSYDEEYVKGLRSEAAGYRTQLRELQDKVKAFEDKDKSELQKAADALKASATEKEQLQAKLRENEIALAAVKHNAIHPEVVARMVPADAQNIDNAITDLKKQYPALFKKVGGADGGAGDESGDDFNMNHLLRRAAGYRS